VLEVSFRAPEPGDEADIAEAQRIMAGEAFTFAFGYVPGDDFTLRALQALARYGAAIGSIVLEAHGRTTG
jgi:hypothetical protein